jgi:hypothetical protein
LILTKPLDKEGVEGPSFINVDVTCHRLNTFDPGLTIYYFVHIGSANFDDFEGILKFFIH